MADNLQDVLESYEREHIRLEIGFLNQALVAATLSDNLICIGKLIKMGARNIDECIQIAKEKDITKAFAMLLLLKIALTGDKAMFFMYTKTVSLSHESRSLHKIPEIKKILLSGDLPTRMPLEVAQQSGHHNIWRELLMLTGVNYERGHVNWNKLNLMSLDVVSLRPFSGWLTEFMLSQNMLRKIPKDFGILKKVTLIDLSDNELSELPVSLLELSSLKTLNVSHNKLCSIPYTSKFSCSLSKFDLSDNCLSSLPVNVAAPSLTSLNVSNNQFTHVPLCICTFTSLTDLNVSGNINIKALPYEMGMLNEQVKLNLNGMKRLKEPPRYMQRNSQECIRYLRHKLTSYADGSYCMQLMIVGNPGRGKRTLASVLQGKERVQNHQDRVQIYDWEYSSSVMKKAFHYRIWVFGDLHDYNATHSNFLYHSSIYLLVFNLKHGSEGLRELKPWLDSIVKQAPFSSVIIIGTHLDVIPQQGMHNVNLLLQQAQMIGDSYGNKLEVLSVLPFGRRNKFWNVANVRDTIQHHVGQYPVLQRGILHEIAINGDKVMELLTESRGKLDPSFFNKALHIAVEKDSDINVGRLALSSQIDVEKYTERAERLGKHNAKAALLLIETAQVGDVNGLSKFGLGSVAKIDHDIGSPSRYAPLVYCDHFSTSISPVAAIELARQLGHTQVRLELIMKTNVYPVEKEVIWSGLKLKDIDVSLIEQIHWVEKLKVDGNELTTLPSVISLYLQQVVKLELQNNTLTEIPQFVFELPNLQELNLSHNKLVELPNVKKWPFCLISLNLYDNQLSSLPEAVSMSICSLNLGKNKFRTVPHCICYFTTLQSLNLSHNPEIVVLPPDMGQLANLTRLDLKGLNKLKDPPKSIQSDCRECIHYLNRKLKRYTPLYRMKLMVVGHANQGKTTLIARLKGQEEVDISVHNLNVSEWSYRPSLGRQTFTFDVWDFGGEKELYACHQCFLSRHSLYLLVFDLCGELVIRDLRFWLHSIACYAPQSSVIIVATHLDMIAEERRPFKQQHPLLNRVNELAKTFKSKLRILEILPVALENRIENVVRLREVVYNHASKCQNQSGQLIMGQMVPASYHEMIKRFEIIRYEVKQGLREPTMHSNDFRLTVYQMKSRKHQDKELKLATLFLIEFCSLLHYDERGHNLNEVYFLDPAWLYDITTYLISECSNVVENGILLTKDFYFILQSQNFPTKHIEQYICLLDKFGVVLPIDNQHLLIPSHLPRTKPELACEDKGVVVSRYFLFTSTMPCANLYGFWSRLLSQILHSVQLMGSDCPPLHDTSHFATDQRSNEASLLLPNIPGHSCFIQSKPYRTYWQTGLYYKRSDVVFSIESLADSGVIRGQRNDGVFIAASPNTAGIKLLTQLVDLLTSLIGEWYPQLQGGLKQKVLCFECVKLKHGNPYEFDMKHCVQAVASNEMTVECRYIDGDPKMNHTVALTYLVPEMLLQDISHDLMLCVQDISYERNNDSLLGRGGYAEVYRGTFKGKTPVAVKHYLSRSREAVFRELRSEATIHCQLRHPCILNLIGYCVQPMMALVFEAAPLNSAAYPLLEEKVSIHRLTMYRMAAEVASALHYMHKQGIIYRDVKAANVLLWSLDPSSLCHCKLCDFGIAGHLSPIGIKGLYGCKGFIAPELLHVGKGNQHSLYDHRADIFPFGMFLYQLITRRHPYHNIPTHRISTAVEQGERPNLQDVPVAFSGYYFLTILMKKCWDDNPSNRPEVESMVRILSHSTMQMVMSVVPLPIKQLPRHAVVVPSSSNRKHELWVCCEFDGGFKLSVYSIANMIVARDVHIEADLVQCLAVCGENVWIVSETSENRGVINILNLDTKKTGHKAHKQLDFTISCISATDDRVYVGTHNGYIISYDNRLFSESKKMNISVSSIDGVVCSNGCVWVSQSECITFLEPETLDIKGSIRHKSGIHIGQFTHGQNHTIYGAKLLRENISAWDAHKRCHLYDIVTADHVQKVCGIAKDVISAMTSALDTVWVGMASGCILVFHKEELLSWYHPFEHYVSFLVCIPGPGPCGLEKCMVASGGENIKPLVPLLDYELEDEGRGSHVILWEVYEAKTMRQIKLIEDRSPGHLNDHESVECMIKDGGFIDGTNLCSPLELRRESDHSTALPTGSCESHVKQDMCPQDSSPHEDHSATLPTTTCDSHVQQDIIQAQDSLSHEHPVHGTCSEVQTTSNVHVSKDGKANLVTKIAPTVSVSSETNDSQEIILVNLESTQQSLNIACSRPAKLDSLVNDISVMAKLNDREWQLAYCTDQSYIRIEDQTDFEMYLAIPGRPPLVVINCEFL